MSIGASIFCSAVSLLTCIIIAFVGPSYTARITAASNSATMSFEHCLLSLLFLGEFYLATSEFKRLRLTTASSKYEPVHISAGKGV